jgi:hypothetical protein
MREAGAGELRDEGCHCMIGRGKRLALRFLHLKGVNGTLKIIVSDGLRRVYTLLEYTFHGI